jgi:hypothetical protein
MKMENEFISCFNNLELNQIAKICSLELTEDFEKTSLPILQPKKLNPKPNLALRWKPIRLIKLKTINLENQQSKKLDPTTRPINYSF